MPKICQFKQIIFIAMKNKKHILIGLSFIIVLLSGFVFGHFIIKNESAGINAGNVYSKQQVNRDITDSRENAITRTVNQVSTAIVGINVTEIREYRDPFGDFFGDDPFFKQYFGNRSYKQEVHGLGSGFIISDDGYIVTNDHVVGNASKVVVSMTNGDHLDAEIVGKDSFTDIALLKVNKSGLPYVNLGNSDNVIIGEWVVALGNPFGLFEVNQKPTVTVGVVSSTGMKLDAGQNRFYRDMIQTDAAINSGNSGGALFNSMGEVIGMNTLIFTGNSYATGNIGLGFAIPINKVKNVIDQLRKSGKIDRNYNLGLRVQTVDANVAQYFKLKNVSGVIVVSVDKGSEADDAGFKSEDIIISLNGEKIASDSDFWGYIVDAPLGTKVKARILRNGEESDKEFEVRTR